MALVNTKSLPNATDRSFTNNFFDAYREYPSEFSRIAKIESRVGQPGRDIKEYEMSGLGDFVDIPEGGAITFDDAAEGHSKQLLFSKNGLGCQLTEEMQEDDLYGNVKKLSSKLAKSGRMKVDNDYFAMFAGAFSGTTYLAWDAKNICKSSHTTLKSGQTISNYGSSGTAVSLSETGLQGGFEYFDGLIDESGFPLVMEGPYILLAAKQLRWMVAKLAKNEGKVGVFDNDINTVRPGNIAGPQGMPESWRPHLTRWFSSSTMWFLLAANHDARLVWKRQLKLQSSDDFATGSRLYKATQRYGVGTFDYKGIYGGST